MHPNPAFRSQTDATNLAFARERAFGILSVTGAAGPLLAHVPFLLAEDGGSADLHLVRTNPIARLELPTPAVVAVSGPDGYVSPDWYGVPDQVPTWNYVAVHLRGTLTALPREAMHDMLDRQSAAYESRLAKTPWTTAKMSPEAMDRMLRQIQPFRLQISEVAGTWKLNQNKPEAVRLAAAALAQTGIGSELPALAGLMTTPPAE